MRIKGFLSESWPFSRNLDRPPIPLFNHNGRNGRQMSDWNRHRHGNENQHREGRRKMNDYSGGGGGDRRGFIRRCSTGRTLVLLSVLCWLGSVHPACELSYVDGGRMYNYSLTAPIPMFPHGVLSEDGFYKVTGNDTVLWFQDCGGTSLCGMECNALVAEDVEGYPVCSAIGHSTTSYLNIADKMNPHMGVTVQMSSGIQKYCSLSVSVVCDWNGVQRPNLLRKLGDCEYATELRHPSGCAKIVYLHGGGWGWFGVFLIIILCVLGSYVIAGAAYRYFILHVHGIDAIPNLEFWTSLPHRAQSVYTHIVQKIQGPSHAERSTYNPVGF